MNLVLLSGVEVSTVSIFSPKSCYEKQKSTSKCKYYFKDRISSADMSNLLIKISKIFFKIKKNNKKQAYWN